MYDATIFISHTLSWSFCVRCRLEKTFGTFTYYATVNQSVLLYMSSKVCSNQAYFGHVCTTLENI